jgi:hypothetical protein
MNAFCSGSGWDCDYQCLGEGGDVECDGLGDPVADESMCDGLDNDCDGITDEGPGINNAASLGTPCDNGGTTGVCLVEGIYACASSPIADPVCCQTVAGNGVCITPVPDPLTLQQPDELAVPNGLDDDCDGLTDEGADGCLTYVNVNYGSGNFDIFAHEASRPDATAASQGSIDTAPCSWAARLPWTMISKAEADTACQLLGGGWDLCSAHQWQYSCQYGAPVAGQPHDYPYGNTYGPNTCNGADYATPDLVPTASLGACDADYTPPPADHVYDLSGNAEEWTATERDLGSGPMLYEIRGGSYNDQAAGLTCDFDFWPRGLVHVGDLRLAAGGRVQRRQPADVRPRGRLLPGGLLLRLLRDPLPVGLFRWPVQRLGRRRLQRTHRLRRPRRDDQPGCVRGAAGRHRQRLRRADRRGLHLRRAGRHCDRAGLRHGTLSDRFVLQ